MIKFRNSIKYKLLVTALTVTVIGIAILFGVSQFIIGPAFSELEKHKAGVELTIIRKTYENEIKHIDLLCTDWATWDDTFEFVKDENEDYIESNLLLDSFSTTDMNLIYIYNDEGQKIFGKCYDLNERIEVDMDKISGVENFMPGVPFPEDYDYESILYGMIKVKDGFYIATATRRIMPSSGDTDRCNGFMVMGKFLNDSFFENMKESVGQDFEVVTCEPGCDLNGFKELPNESCGFLGFATYRFSEKDNANDDVETLLYDVNGAPAFLIAHEIDNSIVDLGYKSFAYLFATISGIFLSLFIVMGLLTRKIVLAPLNKMVEEIGEIQKTQNLAISESANRKDELGYLAIQFNVLLSNLEAKTNQLKVLATTDSMTGILNHKTVMEKLEHEIVRARRYGNSLSVAVLDIDYFKQINDKFGHQVGDVVIKTLVSVIKKEIRETDCFGRYGGDEFLLLFIDQDIENASHAMKRIYDSVASITWEHDNLKATLSSGVTEFDNKIESLRDLIERADGNLYIAKDNGRNNYVCDKNEHTVV